jgi:hypothetical protein
MARDEGEEMDDKDKIILDAAKKYLNGHPPDFKLFRGRKSYTAQQIIEELEKDQKFRAWFVENVLRLSTELFLRGKT